MTNWKPIETAPKDDWSDVLLSGPDGMAVAWFDTDEGEWITDYRGKGNGQYVSNPTHWMPLPPSFEPTGSFIKELTELLNKHNWDTRTDTPDFILADNVVGHLEDLEGTHQRVQQWKEG